GAESGNEENCQGRTIPWLQDEPAQDVWNAWSVTYRDVFVLTEENELQQVYNLTENDLGDPAKYEALKTIIRNLASP
ncbi:MAG: hypothetical protein ACYTG6_16110, partial [Planctomycetota bacterium]